MTVLELLTDVLREITELDADEAPDPADVDLALRYFRALVDSYQAKRLLLYTVTRHPFALTSGQQSRTIGPGGNYDTDRPLWLASATVKPAGQDSEYPLDIYTRQQYLYERLKSLTLDWPSGVFYEPTLPLGTLTFWPVPSATSEVAFGIPEPLTTPAELSTTLVFPPGYERAFRLNIAKDLVRPFGAAMPVDLKDDAKEALGVIKRQNDEPPRKLQSDDAIVGGGCGGRYDIVSGQYR